MSFRRFKRRCKRALALCLLPCAILADAVRGVLAIIFSTDAWRLSWPLTLTFGIAAVGTTLGSVFGWLSRGNVTAGADHGSVTLYSPDVSSSGNASLGNASVGNSSPGNSPLGNFSGSPPAGGIGPAAASPPVLLLEIRLEMGFASALACVVKSGFALGTSLGVLCATACTWLSGRPAMLAASTWIFILSAVLMGCAS